MATGDARPDGSDGQAEASASSEPLDEGRGLGTDDWDERLRLWFWLEQVLDRLPERQRIAIERHMDGASDATIAEEIGCTPGSVKTLRARGMKFLRGDLSAD